MARLAYFKFGVSKMTKLYSTSTKIEKSNKSDYGYYTLAQYLSPASESGWQMCPFRSPACEKTCLGHSSGLMITSTSKNARIWRTTLLMTDRQAYAAQAIKELAALERKAIKAGVLPAARPNADSDITWENVRFPRPESPAISFLAATLMELFPNIQFYDYTKWPSKFRPASRLPANYHLTFSRSENTTLDDIQAEFDAGRNVAVVFDEVPTEWQGWTVINGDADDLRFLDPVGVIVGLKAKGAAKKDTAGFVVRLVTKIVDGQIVRINS
jgi:hypothetical protein